eukprot:4567369-Pleurochrysis_carterae.AAC.1
MAHLRATGWWLPLSPQPSRAGLKRQTPWRPNQPAPPLPRANDSPQVETVCADPGDYGWRSKHSRAWPPASP